MENEIISLNDFNEVINKIKIKNDIINFKTWIEYLQKFYDLWKYEKNLKLVDDEIRNIINNILNLITINYGEKEYNFNFIARIIYNIIEKLLNIKKNYFDEIYSMLINIILSNKFIIVNKILSINIVYLLFLNQNKITDISKKLNELSKLEDLIKILNFKDPNLIYILLNIIILFLKEKELNDNVFLNKLLINLKNTFNKTFEELDKEIKLLIINLFIKIINKNIYIDINLKEILINLINNNNDNINSNYINKLTSKLIYYFIKKKLNIEEELISVVDYLFKNIKIKNSIQIKHLYEILFNIIYYFDSAIINETIFKNLQINSINILNEENFEIEYFFHIFFKRSINLINQENLKDIFNYNFENLKVINYDNNNDKNNDELIEGLNIFMNEKTKSVINLSKNEYILILFIRNINLLLKYSLNKINLNREDFNSIFDYILKNGYKYNNFIQNLFIKMFKLIFKNSNIENIILSIFFDLEESIKDKNIKKLDFNLNILYILFENEMLIENYIDLFNKLLYNIENKIDEFNFLKKYVKCRILDILFQNEKYFFIVIDKKEIFKFINEFNSINYNEISNWFDNYFILKSLIIINKLLITLKNDINSYVEYIKKFLMNIHNLLKEKKFYQINNNFFNMFKYYYFKLWNYFIGKIFPCSTTLLSYLYEEIVENNLENNEIPLNIIDIKSKNLIKIIYNEDEKNYHLYPNNTNIKYLKKDYYYNLEYFLKNKRMKFLKNSLFEIEVDLLSKIFINNKISLKNKISIIKNFLVNISKLNKINIEIRRNKKLFPYFILLIKLLNKFSDLKELKLDDDNNENINIIKETLFKIYLFSLHFNELKIRILVSYGFMISINLFMKKIIENKIFDKLLLEINDNNKRPTIILLNYFLLKNIDKEFIINNKIYFVNSLSRVSRLEELSSKRFLYLCFNEGLKNLKKDFIEILQPCIPFIYLNFLEKGNYDIIMSYFNLKWIKKIYKYELNKFLINNDPLIMKLIYFDLKNLSFSNNLQIINLLKIEKKMFDKIKLLNNIFFEKIIKNNKKNNNWNNLFNLIIQNYKFNFNLNNIKILNKLYKLELSKEIEKDNNNFNFIILYIKDNLIGNKNLSNFGLEYFSFIYLKLIHSINFNEFNINNINIINLSSDIINILIKIKNLLNSDYINKLIYKIIFKINKYFDQFDFKGNKLNSENSEEKLSLEFSAQIINNLSNNINNKNSIETYYEIFNIINFYFKDLYKNDFILFKPILSKIIDYLLNKNNLKLKFINFKDIIFLEFLIDKMKIVDYKKIIENFKDYEKLFGKNFNKENIISLFTYYIDILLNNILNDNKIYNYLYVNNNKTNYLKNLLIEILEIIFTLNIKIEDNNNKLSDFILNLFKNDHQKLELFIKYNMLYDNKIDEFIHIFINSIKKIENIELNIVFINFLKKIKNDDLNISIITNFKKIIIEENSLKEIIKFINEIKNETIKYHFYYVVYLKTDFKKIIDLLEVDIFYKILTFDYDNYKNNSNKLLNILTKTIILIENNADHYEVLDYIIIDLIKINKFNEVGVIIKNLKANKFLIINSIIDYMIKNNLFNNINILNILLNILLTENKLVLDKYLNFIYKNDLKDFNLNFIFKKFLQAKIKVEINKDIISTFDENSKKLYITYLENINKLLNNNNVGKKKLGGLKKLK